MLIKVAMLAINLGFSPWESQYAAISQLRVVFGHSISSYVLHEKVPSQEGRSFFSTTVYFQIVQRSVCH